MRDWPPITEPELLDRLALDHEEFVGYIRRVVAAAGRREFQPAAFERALGYPWERPAGSYILRGNEVESLENADPAIRESTINAFTSGRHPILSFGGNGAPSWLATKFAHFPDATDREVLTLTGHLNDVDVGVAPTPSILGYMPATLFSSSGTAVRAAVLWATPAQVTQLTWSEIGYRLGCLEEAEFVMDEADFQFEESFAYIHRFGAFCIDGAPVALAAIPARGRSAPALTQEELLDVVADLVVTRGARAEDLVRAVFDDMADVFDRLSSTVLPSSQQLQSRWTPFPTSAGA